jgi:WD40 repeat protein
MTQDSLVFGLLDTSRRVGDRWGRETGAQIRRWGPFDNETDTCAIDRRHGRAVLGCDDGRIRLFDLRGDGPAAEIKAHASGIKKVAVSPATGDILSAAYHQRVLVWDAADLRLKTSLEVRPATWERSFNWAPDGGRVLAGTFDGTVLEWDPRTGACLAEVGEPGGNACLNDVGAGGRGDVVLVSDDGVVRLGRLTPQGGEWLGSAVPASGRILMNAVTLVEYGMVVCGAHNHKLHLFDKVGGTLTNGREVALGEGPINCVRMAHQPGYEREVFAACYSGAVVRVSSRGEVRGVFHPHGGAVKALRLHPREPLGVSCSADGALVSWDFTGATRERFLGHTAIVDDVDLDPTGEYLASSGRDFTLKVYRLRDGRMCHSVCLGRRSPKSVCFWDADNVLVGNYWGELLKYHLPTGKLSRRSVARNGISALARQGEHVVATSYDGAAHLVAAEDLGVREELRAMTQRPREDSLG